MGIRQKVEKCSLLLFYTHSDSDISLLGGIFDNETDPQRTFIVPEYFVAPVKAPRHFAPPNPVLVAITSRAPRGPPRRGPYRRRAVSPPPSPPPSRRTRSTRAVEIIDLTSDSD
jgi:hypothetical protein